MTSEDAEVHREERDRDFLCKAPPTSRQLQAMIQEKGVQSVVALYTKLKETDAQPLSQPVFADVVRWLGAWANYAAAEVYRRLGNNPRARELYEEALRLLPSDFDPELDTRRWAIFEGARRNLGL